MTVKEGTLTSGCRPTGIIVIKSTLKKSKCCSHMEETARQQTVDITTQPQTWGANKRFGLHVQS